MYLILVMTIHIEDSLLLEIYFPIKEGYEVILQEEHKLQCYVGGMKLEITHLFLSSLALIALIISCVFSLKDQGSFIYNS